MSKRRAMSSTTFINVSAGLPPSAASAANSSMVRKCSVSRVRGLGLRIHHNSLEVVLEYGTTTELADATERPPHSVGDELQTGELTL